jgi:hypothetical protein
MSDLICIATGTAGDLCLSNCTPTSCSYGSDPGYCLPYETMVDGLCDRGDAAAATVTCTVGAEGCATEYGETTNTLCAQGSGASTYCFERCSVGATGCDGSHMCVPLTDGGGACLAL